MRRVQLVGSVIVLLFGCVCSQAQQVVATNTNVAVPPLVNVSGVLTDGSGRPLTGTVAVTFSLYAEQTGGVALWLESQNVQPDNTGRYKVMLGSTSSSGLAAEIFIAGQAHWLGVQVAEEAEQPRGVVGECAVCIEGWRCADIGGTATFRLRAGANDRGRSSDSNSFRRLDGERIGRTCVRYLVRLAAAQNKEELP